jgi:tetratricopeptide (TPR) repeat protein
MFVVLAGILVLGFPQIWPKTDEWVVKGKRAYFAFIGEQNFSLNKFSEVVAFYSKTINLGGSSVRILGQRAYAYYQLREYDQAREDFSRAIEMVPQEGKYLLFRRKTYLILKQKTAAREDLTAAMKGGNLEAQALLLPIANNHSG